MAAITIKDLTVRYQTSAADDLIIQKLTCEIMDGEFVCFLGPSGCGKTTMLNAIAGIIQYDGLILIQRGNSNSPANIGYAFQTPRLMNWLSMKDNVAFPLQVKNLGAKDISTRIDQYLTLVGIADIKHKFPLQCSEGEKARANIARALAIEPRVVLMDEPFSQLDEITARKLREELLHIWQKDRRTVLFVTHNAMEAVYLADRVCILTDKPSQLKADVKIDVPRPREPFNAQFAQVYSMITTELGVNR